MKKINKCPGGGFAKLQNSMITDEKHECNICDDMLQAAGFNAATLHELLEKARNNELDKELQKRQPAGRELRFPVPKAAEDEKQDSRKSKKRKIHVQQEDPDDFVLEVAASFKPHMRLLPRGAHGRRVPYICTLCKSRAQPDGKIGEIGQWKAYAVKHFMMQHYNTVTHEDNLSKLDVVEVPRMEVKCEGISLAQDMPGSSLHNFQKEFNLWATYANFAEAAKHSYTKDMTEGSWLIRSSSCKKTMEENTNCARQVCVECIKLTKPNSIVRSPIRFARKYFAANLLSARLFQSEAEVNRVLDEIKSTGLWHREEWKMKEIIQLDNHKLQEYVQRSCLCESYPTESFKQWQATIVKPVMRINVSTIPPQLHNIVAQFTSALHSGALVDTPHCPQFLHFVALQFMHHIL